MFFLRQLCQQARVDPELAGLLARGPIEAIDPRGDRKRSLSESDNPIEEIVANKYNNGHVGRILRRDFIVRKTGFKASLEVVFGLILHKKFFLLCTLLHLLLSSLSPITGTTFLGEFTDLEIRFLEANP